MERQDSGNIIITCSTREDRQSLNVPCYQFNARVPINHALTLEGHAQLVFSMVSPSSSDQSLSRTIQAVTDLNEQALFTHASQIAAGHTDFRQVACSDYAAFKGQSDRAVPQRGLWTAGEAYCFGTIPVALAHLRLVWRVPSERDSEFVFLSFVDSGEPMHRGPFRRSIPDTTFHTGDGGAE
jgi:hypothetical protein